MKIDITGQKFNRLTALRPTEKRYQRQIIWLFRCDCGELKESTVYLARSGEVKSCGCLRREKASINGKITGKINGKLFLRHGHATRNGKSPTYNTWASMIKRCTNPNYKEFRYYGGRGVAVCERWRKFKNFLADMGVRPEGRTLDRIDNNGNYEPSNCRWARAKQQSRNRRNITIIPGGGNE